MKRVVLLFGIFVFIAFCLNAQSMQTGTFNDGRLLAFIEQRDVWVSSISANRSANRLILENISGQEIIVHFAMRVYGFSPMHARSIQIFHRTETLRPGQRIRPPVHISGHTYVIFVDAFEIQNVSVRSAQQGVTVPSWAQGLWYVENNRSIWVRVTSNEMITWTGLSGNTSRVDGNTIWFTHYVFIDRTNNPNITRFGTFSDGEWLVFNMYR